MPNRVVELPICGCKVEKIIGLSLIKNYVSQHLLLFEVRMGPQISRMKSNCWTSQIETHIAIISGVQFVRAVDYA